MKRATRIIISLFAVAWLVKEIILPATAAVLYSYEYMELVVECDTAMEASWYYRQNNLIDERTETVQLFTCHDYDKIRKLMLISGLPEAYLSWLGLKGLELYQKPAEEYVEQHRFTER